MTVVPREIEDNGYAKPFILFLFFFGGGGGGGRRVRYTRCIIVYMKLVTWINHIDHINHIFYSKPKGFCRHYTMLRKIHENAIQLYKNMICTKARSRHLINTRKRAYSKRTHRTIIHLLFSSSQWTSSGTKSGGPVITVYHQSVLGTSPRGAQARNIAKLQSDVPESRSWKRRNRGRTGERKNSQRWQNGCGARKTGTICAV